MRGSRAAVVALLAVLAAAGAAMAIEGSLRADALEASGAARILADDPVLAARSRSGALEFTLDGAEGVLEREWAPEAGLYTPVFPGRVWGNSFDQLRQRETVNLDGAAVRSTFARAEAVILVWPEAPGVRSVTLPDTGLRAAGSPPADVHSHADMAARVNGGAIFYWHTQRVDTPHVNVTVAHGAFDAEGPLAIYLFNLDYVVEQSGTTTAYRTGTTTEQDGGAVRGERTEVAILRLTAGRLALRSLHEMELRAPAATLELAGAAVLEGASGALRGPEATWRADGAARLDGEGVYALAPGESGRTGVLADTAVPLRIGVTGEPSLVGFTVARDAVPLLDIDPTTAAGAAAGGGALLLAVIGAVAWRRRQAAPAPEGLLEAAVLRLEAGDHAGALALFNEALARDPRNPTLHLDRAHCLERLGRVAESRRAYEMAVRHAPESGEAHYHLARSLAGSGLAPSAIAHLSRAFSLDPAFAQAAREEPAFRSLAGHPTYADLDAYYRRAT